MEFVSLPEGAKASLWDRFRNAYYAFHMKVNPDVQRVLDEIEKMQQKDDEEQTSREDKLTHAMRCLDGFTQAQVHSVAEKTERWRDVFEQAMLFIEGQAVEDQIVIMQYIFRGNRSIVTVPQFKQWMSRNAEAILNNLPE